MVYNNSATAYVVLFFKKEMQPHSYRFFLLFDGDSWKIDQIEFVSLIKVEEEKMRFVIVYSAIIITYAIALPQGFGFWQEGKNIYVIILTICALMDILEFIKRMKTK